MAKRSIMASGVLILALAAGAVMAQNRITTDTGGVKTEMSSDGRITVQIEMRDNQPWASIENSRQSGTFDCKGRSVSVAGRDNQLVLTGQCPFVDVSGNGNKLRIEASDFISVSGRTNEVSWRRGIVRATPEIADDGRGNQIGKAN